MTGRRPIIHTQFFAVVSGNYHSKSVSAVILFVTPLLPGMFRKEGGLLSR